VASPALPIRQQQRAWARSKGIDIDKSGYTLTLGDNLCHPLSRCAEAEFRAGDGTELGRPSSRGKMQALHSSSALACNVFDYWRGRDTSALAKALEMQAPICSMAFEQKYPTGLRGKPPNLDVVLQPWDGPTLAVESKFLEPYAGASAKSGFKPKYFETEPGLLPHGCRATSEYSRRYPRRTSCKDHAIRSRYAALPVRCPASGRGETEAAAQCRIRRSPRRRFACSSTR